MYPVAVDDIKRVNKYERTDDEEKQDTVNYFFIEADEHGISLSEEPEVRRC